MPIRYSDRALSFARMTCVLLFSILLCACAGKASKVNKAPKPQPQVVATQAPVATPVQLTEFKRAQSLLTEQKVAQAKQILETLLKQEPRFAGVAALLGQIALEQNNKSQALIYFEQALSANPYQAEALVALANRDQEQGDFAAAEEKLLRAVNKSPDHAQAHHNLAVLYELYLRQYESAISHYERYLALISNAESDSGTQSSVQNAAEATAVDQTDASRKKEIKLIQRYIKLLERKL